MRAIKRKKKKKKKQRAHIRDDTLITRTAGNYSIDDNNHPYSRHNFLAKIIFSSNFYARYGYAPEFFNCDPIIISFSEFSYTCACDEIRITQACIKGE